MKQMKNIYLYGASDDCHEVETDFDKGIESYGDLAINQVRVHFHYDGDWGIELIGDIPESWKVKTISGNAPSDFRYRKDAGQFIHIQVPEDEVITYTDFYDTDNE